MKYSVALKPYGGFQAIKLRYCDTLIDHASRFCISDFKHYKLSDEFKLAWTEMDREKMAKAFTNDVFKQLHFPMKLSMGDILGKPKFSSENEREEFMEECIGAVVGGDDYMKTVCHVTAVFIYELKREAETPIAPVEEAKPMKPMSELVSEAHPLCNDIIVTLLHAQLYITDGQMAEAKLLSEKKGITVTQALQELYGITDHELIAMIASIYGMETFDFDGYVIPDEALASVPADVARKYGFIPVSKNGDFLTIAISDPSDLNLLDTINRIIGSVDIVVSTKSDIESAIEKYYKA